MKGRPSFTGFDDWYKYVERRRWSLFGTQPSAKYGSGSPGFFEANRVAMHNPSGSRRLVDLISRHWNALATDPRDKIYAPVGIASDCQHLVFPIDYSVSYWKAYLQTFEFLIETTGSLDLLLFSGIGEYEAPMVTIAATWTELFYGPLGVRKLTSTWQYLSLANGVNNISAARNTWANAKIVSKENRFYTLLGVHLATLHTEGCRVDVISQCLLSCYGPLNPLRLRWKFRVGAPRLSNDFPRHSSDWLGDKDDIELVDSIKAVCNIIFDTNCPLAFLEDESPRKKQRTEELWRTLVYNRTIDGLVAPPNWNQVFSVLLKGPSRIPFEFIPQRSAQSFSQLELARFYVAPYLAAVKKCLGGGRWLYMTQHGHLGIANAIAKPRNHVCVMKGCSSPVIVGPDTRYLEDPSLGAFRGCTYLHGYMQGKAMDDLDSGNLRLETFNLG
ncbi:hypothetical protein BDZ45DRAFT_355169 [Acephala macrosclerotiorum]|nr:hypothetical protein BDZ45DRAFT_355169 [Acephala macrosclerotiorum]